ncbi:MAG: hypothetical protein ACK40G_15710 [Cytophagaceae bacterium]
MFRVSVNAPQVIYSALFNKGVEIFTETQLKNNWYLEVFGGYKSGKSKDTSYTVYNSFIFYDYNYISRFDFARGIYSGLGIRYYPEYDIPKFLKGFITLHLFWRQFSYKDKVITSKHQFLKENEYISKNSMRVNIAGAKLIYGITLSAALTSRYFIFFEPYTGIGLRYKYAITDIDYRNYYNRYNHTDRNITEKESGWYPSVHVGFKTGIEIR